MIKLKKIAVALILTVIFLNIINSIEVKASGNTVRTGIDNMDYYSDIFKDKRVGLITNKTGVDSNLNSSIDVLKTKTNLVKLFAPEHGIRGEAAAGSTVKDDYDAKSGLKVYSLYGNTKKPTEDMLRDVDILAYDIQDVGSRFYTYISTMAYAMQSCAQNNKTFVVFDRPNPASGEATQGVILNSDFSSFVGVYPIATRYGLTVGELAKLFNKEYGINCKLVVIPMSNWTRNMYYEDTGLNTWIAPSPNIQTITTAIVYSGTCIFEGTNVSEGRGTLKPFEYIGAPYIDGDKLAGKMNSLNIQGVNFKAIRFTPTTSKYSTVDNVYKATGNAVECGGVEVEVTDRETFNSVKTGVALLYTIRDMYASSFKYNGDNFIDKLWGNSELREGKYSLSEIYSVIDKDESAFSALEKKYYIYGNTPQDFTQEVVKETPSITKDNPSVSNIINKTNTNNKVVLSNMNLIKWIVVIILIIILLLVIVGITFINFSPQFGAKTTGDHYEKIKSSKNFKNSKFINIEKSDFIENNSLSSYKKKQAPDVKVIWFGHSALLLEVNGKKIFLDPMLGKRCSPLSFIGPKRFNGNLPMKIEDIPELDAVLISHDHYDHLDYSSITKLKNKVKMFYVPLGVAAHLKAWGVEETKIVELDWWEQAKFEELTFVCTPSHHFSGRGLLNRDNTLWCSWVIKGENENIFFSGDSGYSKNFKKIGDKFGPFDLTLLECGQYNKGWHDIHMFPEETVRAHIDLRGELLLPIHWAAFKLSFHPWQEPVERLIKSASALNVEVTTPRIGEPVILGKPVPCSKWWKDKNYNLKG